MTDLEFDILDELYFVTSYPMLKEATGLEDDVLVSSLIKLVEKQWVKIMTTIDEDWAGDTAGWVDRYPSLFYLATKKGLLKHNSR